MRYDTDTFVKYPSTHHIEGSNLQPGDDDSGCVPFSHICNRPVVLEEKMDGSNCAISFSPQGKIRFQSRGHYLTGGERERHFDALKQFGYAMHYLLQPILTTRYILYGEWMFAKHTIYYDRLPHYFMEFDILDRESGNFLDTEARERLLAPVRPQVVSVRVLYAGLLPSYEAMLGYLGPSAFVHDDENAYRSHFRVACQEARSRIDIEEPRTDLTRVMEGLYIKVEEGGIVSERYKWVRPNFLQCILASNSHWQSRPIVKNGCAE